MRRHAFVTSLALLLLAGVASAGVGVGDRPPALEGKEFVHTDPVTLKDLQGKVVLYEIFRTW